MKTKLFWASLLAITVQQTVLAQTDANGYTTVNMTMGGAYANRVFFDLSANSSVSQVGDNWDIAFYRNNAMDKGVKINDAKTVTIYEASGVAADFDSVNPSQIATWGTPLYNPDVTNRLQDGAFDTATKAPAGPLNFGWGTYDAASHTVNGSVTFVLDYGNSNYIKFFITSFAAGYTFKYAVWNGSAWGTTQTKTIANGTDDSYFNYFSFTTGDKVPNMEPPKANWDFMFTRYYTNYVYPGGSMMYKMAGVLQSPTITVAKVQPETQETAAANLPASTAFSSGIATIGHSWKPTSGVYSDVVYYIKQGSEYYRMYFISNGGTTNGNMYFKYKNITSTLSIAEVGKKATFGIYPNPTTADKKVTVLFDVKEKANNKGSVEVYDLTGKRVYNAALSNQTGFYKQDMNLSHLPSGNYIVKISYGGTTETKKLIVK